ncbi:uncharacterized protein A1O5_07478 [Cladophialophora psammophila CBS 110553]|uniref:NACHT domain-containing protein n=1 Tax=Cladophialophora psammophila CBS 110553 TaxID=1182543 RepID=W9WMQ2_9EURO|nr:uncharacterized protein A1O5_07478 [Cladophialophora psammophila CBS 110553]EXJ69442.1 hypothetical protein A1O5_07478 [Cladophialophora psammophila CBS 110553]
MLDRRSNIDHRHGQSCEWIQDNEIYQNWHDSRDGLLWIKGRPGSGKSTLMSFIYSTLKKDIASKHSICLDFFFHARGSELQKSPLGMLRCLLNQLYTQSAAIRGPIRTAYKEKQTQFGSAGRIWQWQQRELEKLLIEAVEEAAQSRRLIIFVDALDEAGKDAANTADYFHQLDGRLSRVQKKVSICMSSRHYPITSSMPSVEITVEHYNRKDIMSYMEKTLRDSTLKAVPHDDFSDWNDFVTEITERAAAGGIFQWARLVAPLARKYLLDGHSPLEIRQRLGEVPAELDSVYRHILQHVIDVGNRKRSLRLFQWVCLAFRPLSVTELQFALAAEDAMSSPCRLRCQDTHSFVDSDERMKKCIVSWSGGLMEVVPGSRRDMLSTLPDKRIYVDQVQVIHQSVNDFFTSKPVNEPFITCGLSLLSSLAEVGQEWRHNEPKAWNPGYSIYESHAVLFRGCLNYLGSEELRIKGDKYGGPCIEPLPPFLEYAASQIFHHASCSEGTYFFCHERHLFLKHMNEILPTWLEVCHLVVAWRHLHFDDKCPTLLHVASTLDLIELVTGLLEDGTSHEQQDQHGRRPLHYAARAGSMRVAQALLAVGAEIEVNCDKNETPLSLAASVGEADMVTLLLTHALQTNQTLGSLDAALLAAAEGGSIDHQPEGCLAVARLLLTAGANANAEGGQWANPLQTAVWGGDVRQVQLLIEKGAKVNAQGGQFNTAVIAASYMGEVEMVRLLIKHGANVNAQGGEYGTALQLASGNGHEDVVRLLVENGAGVNTKWEGYGTALDAACLEGHLEVAKYLIENGADVTLAAVGTRQAEDFNRLLRDMGRTERFREVD